MARKPTPNPARATAKSSAPTTYSAWKAAAVEITGGRVGTMPEREWKRCYITGLDPESVAALADTYKRNTVAADRKRKR
jgi:hypothetical protein